MWKKLYNNIRFFLSLYVSKFGKFIIDTLHLGAGYTWPGHVALMIYPEILNHSKMNFPKGVVLISGTNGKTTTSKLLTHLLEESGFRVVNNKTGANLLNGIVSEILLNMNLGGDHNSDIGVFEVDEYHLPSLLKFTSPNVLVLLNLSRDQLDRYGEVDLILERWEKAIEKIEPTSEIVIDGTQKYFNHIPTVFAGEVTRFDDSGELMKLTNLVGSFNAKNVNAAVFTAELVGVSEKDINAALASFDYAYGRGEIVGYKGKTYKILLAKNPASFNNNLDAVLSGEVCGDALLFILNDNIPDGRDVSWIYDIDPNKLKDSCNDKKIFVCGTRSLDMAVRLKYADVLVEESDVCKDINSVLKKIYRDQSVENIVVFPNYSAMLEIRKELTGREIL